MKHKQIMKFLTDKEFQAYLGKEQAHYLIEHENLIIPFSQITPTYRGESLKEA